MQRTSAIQLPASGASGFSFQFNGGSGATSSLSSTLNQTSGRQKTIQEIIAEVISENPFAFSKYSLPIGTILTWHNEYVLPDLEKYGRWVFCNGGTYDPLEYPEFESIVGGMIFSGYIPSFDGTFLRAQDKSNGGAGGVYNPDGRLDLGLIQVDSTALPSTPFVVSSNPSGTLQFDTKYSAGSSAIEPACGNSSSSTTYSRIPIHQHQHLIQYGGDSETRPLSYTITYIIKIAHE